ncbi:kynureninase [Actinosynnema sp. ALI-1.44]|uniref:kynureninase n=1 Tax=Actinosynnema sp. ALI-1.44 TaxID=1933779 RepID=UPI00097C1DAE|nr:kynureninase [Actinosynnema sp. ALI-1.44]ONI81708.1 kynureninase [Actinosynnema sp. ALI-1.44]
MITRRMAEELDAADPLARLRDRFVIDDPGLVYLDGNSLGRLPAATADFLDAVVRDQWGTGLVRTWHTWIDWASRLGDRLAEHVLGARPGEVVLSDSTSVNLYKLAAAVLAGSPERRTIVLDAEDFPTDRYIVQGLAAERGLSVRALPSDVDAGLDLDELSAALDDDVALVVLSHASYRSGALNDMAAVNALARRAGAVVLWDLSHSAGVFPVQLHASGADLAVGCTYKYLNGGPGAPAFLYVRKELRSTLRQPIWGWFGQRDQFRMGTDYHPVDGIERFLVGTPPVLSLAAVDPALAVVEEAGVARIRDKGKRLGEFVIDLAPTGMRVASPLDSDRRGGHVTLEHPDAWRICQALGHVGVICDYREPNRLRIGPSPLYTRFVDVWDAMDRLRDLLASRAYEQWGDAPGRVT